LAQPPGCPPDLYGVMESCWLGVRRERPTFAALRKSIGQQFAAVKDRKIRDIGAEVIEHVQRKIEAADFEFGFGGFEEDEEDEEDEEEDAEGNESNTDAKGSLEAAKDDVDEEEEDQSDVEDVEASRKEETLVAETGSNGLETAEEPTPTSPIEISIDINETMQPFGFDSSSSSPTKANDDGDAKSGAIDGDGAKKAKKEKKANAPKLTQAHIGRRVLVDGYSTPGMLRFVGEHATKKALRYGVQFATPIGKNDGSVGGHRYFICPPNCGVLVVPHRAKLMPEQREKAAAEVFAGPRVGMQMQTIRGMAMTSTLANTGGQVRKQPNGNNNTGKKKRGKKSWW